MSRPTERPSEGDIVQIDPGHDVTFGGCLLMVTEVKSWGVQGFVAIPEKGGGTPGEAYYRIEHGKYKRIGPAMWVPPPDPAEAET